MKNTTTALILAGDGYALTISPEAEARKQELLAGAACITTVTSNDESADAQVHSRSLAQMRIEVEKSRKEVKEPVNRIAKLIDQTAKDFMLEIAVEEARITRLVGDHAQEVARLKRLKEEEERKAFEQARAAKEAAERAAAQAEETRAHKTSIADILLARKAAEIAESERKATLAAKLAASSAVAETKVADGVRFVWDFEVEDIALLATVSQLVTIEPRRAAILALFKEKAEAGRDVAAISKTIGLRAFQKSVVSSR